LAGRYIVCEELRRIMAIPKRILELQTGRTKTNKKRKVVLLSS
jgi:hypothetical protein